MRYWAPVLLAIAVALGAVQIVSSIALRGSAEPGSWVRLVPETLALRVERIDPAFPLPAPVRLVLAQRAIDENDPARAEAELAKVPESRDRLALEGRLAQARGDAAGAVRAYLAADDLEDIELQVGALARERRPTHSRGPTSRSGVSRRRRRTRSGLERRSATPTKLQPARRTLARSRSHPSRSAT